MRGSKEGATSGGLTMEENEILVAMLDRWIGSVDPRVRTRKNTEICRALGITRRTLSKKRSPSDPSCFCASEAVAITELTQDPAYLHHLSAQLRSGYTDAPGARETAEQIRELADQLVATLGGGQ